MPATNPATVAESVAPMGRSYAHFAGDKWHARRGLCCQGTSPGASVLPGVHTASAAYQINRPKGRRSHGRRRKDRVWHDS